MAKNRFFPAGLRVISVGVKRRWTGSTSGLDRRVARDHRYEGAPQRYFWSNRFRNLRQDRLGFIMVLTNLHVIISYQKSNNYCPMS